MGTPGTSAGSTGVDPAFILGIARSESSLATNPNVYGGQYNVYGNGAHFAQNLYTDYVSPTQDAFNLIAAYILSNTVGLDTKSMYVKYEGESKTSPVEFNRNLGYLQQTDSALFGNLNNVKYDCDSARRAQLAAALGSNEELVPHIVGGGACIFTCPSSGG